MTSFMASSVKHFAAIKAAREIKKEIDKAKLEDLKTMAEAGISIVATYLQSLPPQERGEKRREFNGFIAMGITVEMVLDEIIRQMPELAPIIEKKPDYKKNELQKVTEFLKGG